MLKQNPNQGKPNQGNQPPSGGCVLKLKPTPKCHALHNRQPPSGGCVLKLQMLLQRHCWLIQPPSGGCVLKQRMSITRLKMSPSRLRAAVC